MIVDLILLGSLTFYALLVVLFLVGLRRPRGSPANTAQHRVSVVVAARNEEENIRECLASLARQTYAREFYEVVLVDDHSSDATSHIAKEMSPLFHSLTILSPPDDPVLKGKTNALAHGIRHASGEIVMITDADCVVPPTWIDATVRWFTPGVGMVSGMTLQGCEGPLAGLQSLDWTYLLGIASSAINLRQPLSTIGNNLSFRRQAYDDVGGYESLKFSLIEDYALFHAIVARGTWDYLAPLDPSQLVQTKPCHTLRELVQQKHRWGKGGLDIKLRGLIVMAGGFFMHCSAIAGFFLGAAPLAASVLLAKFLADYIFLHSVLRKVRQLPCLRYFYWFELYFLAYTLLLPVIVLFGGAVEWKGRKY